MFPVWYLQGQAKRPSFFSLAWWKRAQNIQTPESKAKTMTLMDGAHFNLK